MTTNEKAFLDMLAWAEIGPGLLAKSDRGYNVLVGSTPSNLRLFYDYSDHPRVYNSKMNSTAAGRYQILKRIYDFYRQQLKLKDFSPASQDAIAMQLIRECGAVKDINAGRIRAAIDKVRSRWASMPGAGYGQHEQRIDDLLREYVRNGGTLENNSEVTK